MESILVKKAILEVLLFHVNNHSVNPFYFVKDWKDFRAEISYFGELLLMNGSKVVCRKVGSCKRYFINTYSQTDTSFWKNAIRQIENEEFSCQVCV